MKSLRVIVIREERVILQEWTDERLVWDPTQYDGVRDIVVRTKRIWTPEIAIINGAEDMVQEFEKIRVLVASNGLAHWEPGGVFATTCDINILFFPFDNQGCPIEIGCLHAVFFSRRTTFYFVNVILPCSLLSVLILLVFCVPPDAGEKLSIGISVLLAFTVFLLMLAESVPRTSLDVRILVIYLSITMSLGTASVFLIVIVLGFHYRVSHVPVPNWVRRVFSPARRQCTRFPEGSHSAASRRGSTRLTPSVLGDKRRIAIEWDGVVL